MYSRVAIAFSVLSPIFKAFISGHLCQRSLRSDTTAEDLGRILISNQSTDHLPLGRTNQLRTTPNFHGKMSKFDTCMTL